MLRHRASLLVAIALALVAAHPEAASAQAVSAQPASAQAVYAGPTQILLVDADSVAFWRTLDWRSANVRHQEKLLLVALRMRFWRDHLPPDMRSVYDALGYPTGRVLLTPTGHAEEWWYYGQLSPPLRFRDGALLDGDRFGALTRR